MVRTSLQQSALRLLLRQSRRPRQCARLSSQIVKLELWGVPLGIFDNAWHQFALDHAPVIWTAVASITYINVDSCLGVANSPGDSGQQLAERWTSLLSNARYPESLVIRIPVSPFGLRHNALHSTFFGTNDLTFPKMQALRIDTAQCWLTSNQLDEYNRTESFDDITLCAFHARHRNTLAVLELRNTIQHQLFNS